MRTRCMKATDLFHSLLLTLLFTLAVPLLHARTEPWTLVLLDATLHVGDDSIKSFRVPRPQAKEFRKEFELPPHIKHSVADSFVIVVSIADLVMPRDKHRAKSFREGNYHTKVLVNGSEVVVLNKLAKLSESPTNVERIEIEIEGTALKDGKNLIEILPGAEGKNLDDFELHRIELIAPGQ